MQTAIIPICNSSLTNSKQVARTGDKSMTGKIDSQILNHEDDNDDVSSNTASSYGNLEDSALDMNDSQQTLATEVTGPTRASARIVRLSVFVRSYCIEGCSHPS